MKTIYGIAYIIFVCLAVFNNILGNEQANSFLIMIMAFEMAILYKLED